MILRRLLLSSLVFSLSFGACQEKRAVEKAVGDHLQSVDESAKLADFTLRTLAGETVNLRRLEGQNVVVVNFWATWCGPCRHEIPDFNTVYTNYRERGVEILGISLDEDPHAAVPAFAARVPIMYPVLVGSPEVAWRYNVQSIPQTYIIARSGRIVSSHVGALSAAQLQAALDKALGPPSAS